LELIFNWFEFVGHVTEALTKNMTMDEFFDKHELEKDNDVRTFLKTRLQLLIRSLNTSALKKYDLIDYLLISENDMLTKAFQKLELPF
jgi:hypothetical protein